MLAIFGGSSHWHDEFDQFLVLADSTPLKLVLAIFCGAVVAIGMADRIPQSFGVGLVVVVIGLADRIPLKLVLAILGGAAVAIGMADRIPHKFWCKFGGSGHRPGGRNAA